jgi:predicted ABC-type ATPase
MRSLRSLIRQIILESLSRQQRKPKLIFLAGLPGGGKSTAVNGLGLGALFTSCNLDDFYEPHLRQHGVPLNFIETSREMKEFKDKMKENPDYVMSTSESKRFEELKRFQSLQTTGMFQHAMPLFKDKVSRCLANGENVIIDGTSGNMKKILKEKAEYEEAGYDVGMIFIEITEEFAQQRNVSRGQSGGRALQPFILSRVATQLATAKETYVREFDPFWTIDNTGTFEDYTQNISEIRDEVLDWVHS